ncbi:MAG: RNA polymerase factor sigma-54 [Kiritimatiellae bacterium]|nr:RNA polymerase factor sigma-54 [Kiritimatiellia bacterium]
MLEQQLLPRQTQTQTLSPKMQQGLAILQRPITELRAELQRQMSLNPAIESIEWRAEVPMSAALPEAHVSGSVSEKELEFNPSTPQGIETLSTDDSDRDQFLKNMENFEPSSENGAVDPDAQTRRQAFFDRQVKTETLQDHLLAQIPLSDIKTEDRRLAETLVYNINDDGYFTGSIPDIQMTSGMVTEAHVLAILAQIGRFDPLGCGGRNLRECLLMQMEKLDDSPWEDEVRALVDRHIPDLMAKRMEPILKDLKIDAADFPNVLAELRKLTRHPGRGFQPREDLSIYIEPEVYVVQTASGAWKVRVPEGYLPKVVISRDYRRMQNDRRLDAEARSYARKSVDEAESLLDSMAERQETIRRIAQAIVNEQSRAFDARSLSALRPLTMDQVAEATGLHSSTVSRAVNGKYMATPMGIIEMRKFFLRGVATEGGDEEVAKTAVINRIRSIIEGEDPAKPLSDQSIVEILKKEHVVVARRTVAKYREELKIPGTRERRKEKIQ